MDKNTIYTVKNRSAGMVVYRIPEDGIRREFQPGEEKKIRHDELEKLSYQPGGRNLINDYLLIFNNEAIEELAINAEPEYFMTEQDVIKLIEEGSLDAWLDALDFAPPGTMDLIKKFSVSVPLNDIEKRRALKKKTGFDVDKAIYNEEQDKMNEAPAEAPKRRVQPAAENANPARRTTPKYNVISKQD